MQGNTVLNTPNFKTTGRSSMTNSCSTIGDIPCVAFFAKLL